MTGDYVVEVRWLRTGDHPLDNRETFGGEDGIPFLGEGKIVRYFRRPEPRYRGYLFHDVCTHSWHEHGWIDQGGDGEIVCPGDVVIFRTDLQKRFCIPYNEYLLRRERGDFA